MAQFPIRQADVLELAQLVASGLDSNPAVYPAPPVSADDLQSSLAGCKAAIDQVVATYAAYKATLQVKDGLMAEMAGQAKSCLRYAENVTDFDDDKLKLLGWSSRRKGEPLKPPGQVGSLKALEQGDGWVVLKWKAPRAGGKVVAYRIQRDEKGQGKWVDAGISLVTEVKLSGQLRFTEFRYRVIAINKAGEGETSNTVKVVL